MTKKVQQPNKEYGLNKETTDKTLQEALFNNKVVELQKEKAQNLQVETEKTLSKYSEKKKDDDRYLWGWWIFWFVLFSGFILTLTLLLTL